MVFFHSNIKAKLNLILGMLQLKTNNDFNFYSIENVSCPGVIISEYWQNNSKTSWRMKKGQFHIGVFECNVKMIKQFLNGSGGLIALHC